MENELPLRRWLAIGGIIAVLATVVVVFQEMSASSEQEAWASLDATMASEEPIPALESAREVTRGTSAGPWASYQLAVALYEEGTVADIQRAEQVAQSSISENPGHATTELLQKLLDVLKTYDAPAG